MRRSAVIRRQRFQRLAHPRQNFQRMGGHLTSEMQQVLQQARRHLAVGHLDRGLDHRQHEALPAETVDLEIALLGFQQMVTKALDRRIGREQRREALFGQTKDTLRVPERVVRIECDGGDRFHGGGS